jgi:hypothetical protein
LLLAGVAHADPLSIRQAVTPSTVHLGEPFVRELVLTHPKDQRYELQLPAEQAEFEILDVQRQRVDQAETATTTFRVKMSAFELGKRTLPGLDFEVTTSAGTSHYTSQESGVEITPTLPPDADKKGEQLQDIRPPETIPVRTYALLWAALGVLLVVAAALVARRLWKKRRPIAPVAPVLPLAVRTRNALAALAADDLPGKGMIKEFYSRLSDIVRGYLHERYDVDALECTTTELLDNLSHVDAPRLPREALAALLQESDLVKFARAQMSPESCDHALAFANRLLELTSPRTDATSTDAPERKLP